MILLSLGWVELDDEHLALVFERTTWRLFELRAKAQQTTAQEMIAEAVVKVLGNVHRVH
jgi:hypothetical protein